MSNISSAKRIVVKVGTSTLTYETGKINIRRMVKLCSVLADLHNSGMEVVLVTSGAIGVGVGKLGLKERPKDIPGRQAAATVGQCELMFMYDKHFGENGVKTGQLLITKSDIENTQRRENLENYIKRLKTLEELSESFKGVEKAFAIQAGREVRIIVNPEAVSDEEMIIVARNIVEKIEQELEYPGQIKVNLIRETRAVDFAKYVC